MRVGPVWIRSLVALAAFATSLHAQDPDTIRAERRPFVEGGVYDKPYLTRLLGRTAVGGYAEAHSRFEQEDGITEEAGFLLKRWNIFTATQVSDFVRIAAELEFEDGAREIKLEFAAIDVGIHPSLGLRAGAILSPLGRFNLTHDSPRNHFTDRPLVSTEILGVALTEPGLGILGLFAFGSGRLTYELYAVNGFHDGLIYDSQGVTRIPAGQPNFEDNNHSPALVGRLAWSPTLGYELGLSGHHGAYNLFRADGEAVEERHDVSMWVLDFEAMIGGVELLGEGVLASIGIPSSLRGIYASKQRGLYVEALRPFGRGWIRTMPGSSFVLGARFDTVDFDAALAGDAESRLSVGLNFRPTEDSALKLDYVRGRRRDRFNNPADHVGFLFSVATYF